MRQPAKRVSKTKGFSCGCKSSQFRIKAAALERTVYDTILDKPLFGYEGVIKGVMVLRIYANAVENVDSVKVIIDSTQSKLLPHKALAYFNKVKFVAHNGTMYYDCRLTFEPHRNAPRIEKFKKGKKTLASRSTKICDGRKQQGMAPPFTMLRKLPAGYI